MEDFRNVVEQLEEAKSFIKRGSIATCRIALILIDNTVELILHRTSELRLSSYEMNSRLNARIREARASVPEGTELPEMPELPELSASTVRGIRRSFPDKVRFLVGEKFIDVQTGECLVELHETRNAAYHRGETNPTTMYTLAMIYFRTACKVFRAHSPEFLSGSESKMEYFYQRYGIENYWKDGHGMSSRISDALASDMQLFAGQIRKAFAQCIREYLERVERAVGFLVSNSSLTNRLEHFKLATYLAKEDSYPVDPNDRLENLDPEISDEVLATWNKKVETWNKIDSIEEIYLDFCRLERSILPLLNAIERLESDLEQAIEIQSDIARGK